MSNVTLMQGDCLDKLKEIDDNSVDSIVTDPPYGLDKDYFDIAESRINEVNNKNRHFI